MKKATAEIGCPFSFCSVHFSLHRAITLIGYSVIPLTWNEKCNKPYKIYELNSRSLSIKFF